MPKIDQSVRNRAEIWAQIYLIPKPFSGFPSSASGKSTHLPMQETLETWVWSLGQEDPWRRAWQPTPVFLLGESPMDRGAWWATVHRVTKSRTWLKWLSTLTHKPLSPPPHYITPLRDKWKTSGCFNWCTSRSTAFTSLSSSWLATVPYPKRSKWQSVFSLALFWVMTPRVAQVWPAKCSHFNLLSQLSSSRDFPPNFPKDKSPPAVWPFHLFLSLQRIVAC